MYEDHVVEILSSSLGGCVGGVARSLDPKS